VAAPFEGARVSDGDDVQSIAKKRGVQAVVRGTVQRGGDEIRVTYSLVDADSGRMLAASTITQPAAELFELQDAVAEDLVQALGRTTTARPEVAASMLAPEDQGRFTEAVGLLQNVRDEKSVDRAIATLESILRNARESGAANALLARALLYKALLARRPELIEQATIYARRGVTLSALDPESHITLGRLLNAAGRYDEAIAAFNRGLALRANEPDAVLGIAEALKGQGRDADAEKHYRRAIALRPDGPAGYVYYGNFCRERGRYAEAAAHLRKVTELTPDFAIAHANLGAALYESGRYDEALSAFQKSLALSPSAIGWSNLGTLQYTLGRYAEAKKSYQEATRLSPTDYVVWANLGDACLAAKDAACQAEAWPRAISAARSVLQINQGDAMTRAILASALAKHGDLGAAQEEIRRALETDPTNRFVLYNAAVVATLRENHGSALSWLERAIRAGYPPGDAQSDPVLAPLRKLPAFNPAVKSSA
jgi:tetratricopeptide (TPR) repeat protein